MTSGPRVGAFAQVDWMIHRQSSEDELDPSTARPLNRDRFYLRRARLWAEGESGYTFGRIELDANTLDGVSVRPYDVNVGLRWPAFPTPRVEDPLGQPPALSAQDQPFWAVALIGLFRIPFGFDATEPTLARTVLERTTMVRAFFPGQRDFGAGFELHYEPFSLALALMNGAPIGETGAFAPELNRSKDVVGRIGAETAVTRLIRVGWGFSGLSGQGLHPGTPQTKDRLAWADGNEDGQVELSELTVIPGAPATPSRNYSRFALGADVRVSADIPVLGRFTAYAELMRAKNLDRGIEPADPVAAGRDLRELGWVLGARQHIADVAEVAVRYDCYDPDSDARRAVAVRVVPRDARYRTLAFAAGVRLEKLRFIAEYDHNRNALGRGANGAPANLKDDALAVRAEYRF